MPRSTEAASRATPIHRKRIAQRALEGSQGSAWTPASLQLGHSSPGAPSAAQMKRPQRGHVPIAAAPGCWGQVAPSIAGGIACIASLLVEERFAQLSRALGG